MYDSIDFWKKPNRANMIGLFLNIQNQTNFLVMKKSNWSRVDYVWFQVNLDLKSNLFLKIIESNLDLKF